MAPPSWEQATLAKMIESRVGSLAFPEAKAIAAALTLSMPNIEIILSKSSTAPLDFTLHDEGHAFRVAQRMIEVIPDDAAEYLSTAELALLLLSAYLHDIGMSPERATVRPLYCYLLTGDTHDIEPVERVELRCWLDLLEEECVIPISPSRPTRTQLGRAATLTTQYARHRHNDWSEHWIRKNLSQLDLGYAQSLDNLVALCRSHHEDYNDLIGDRYDPVPIATNPVRVVHLRYLACVLRISDILENDPERTPPVVYQHRNVAPSSAIFWLRDHYAIQLIEDEQVTLHSRPSSALVHKAVLDLADSIDRELQTVAAISEAKPFSGAPFLQKPLPHTWALRSVLKRDIKEAGSYVYMDATFRPSPEKVLKLLSGTALYGNSLAAIKELLQNAFDAVKEQIAYQRLESLASPSTGVSDDALANTHSIVLTISRRDDHFEIACKDSGVGMTKGILSNHVLVVGNSRHADVVQLQRRCRDAGFELNRTGQFGIGVLSYFMVADRVTINTRRSQLAGDEDRTGWEFESHGIGSFGELRPSNHPKQGTEISLSIRPNIIEDLPGFAEAFRFHICQMINHIPCHLEVAFAEPTIKSMSIGHGWLLKENYYAEVSLPPLRIREHDELPDELRPTGIRQTIEATHTHMTEVRRRAKSCQQFDTLEGPLPGNLGIFRALIPYFTLPEGFSFAYLETELADDGTIVRPMHGQLFHNNGLQSHMSWRGMKVDVGFSESDRWILTHHLHIPAWIDIDWRSHDAGKLSLNRRTFELTDAAKSSLVRLLQSVQHRCVELIQKHADSPYSLLNSRLLHALPPPSRTYHWLDISQSASKSPYRWRALTFPVTIASDRATFASSRTLLLAGTPVSVAPYLPGRPANGTAHSIAWPHGGLPPHRMVMLPDSTLHMAPLWEHLDYSQDQLHRLPAAAFPPGWEIVAGCVLRDFSIPDEGRPIWNSGCRLVTQATAQALQWCIATLGKNLDPLMLRSEIESDVAKAASWILACLQSDAFELYNGVVDRAPDFLTRIWALVFGNEVQQVALVDQTMPDAAVAVLSPVAWATVSVDSLTRSLPEPGTDWCITYA